MITECNKCNSNSVNIDMERQVTVCLECGNLQIAPTKDEIIELNIEVIKRLIQTLNTCNSLTHSWVIAEKTLDCKHTYQSIREEIRKCFEDIKHKLI